MMTVLALAKGPAQIKAASSQNSLAPVHVYTTIATSKCVYRGRYALDCRTEMHINIVVYM